MVEQSVIWRAHMINRRNPELARERLPKQPEAQRGTTHHYYFIIKALWATNEFRAASAQLSSQTGIVLANVILGGAFTKTKVKSTVVAGEKPILEHSEATNATVSDALTTAQDNNFISSRYQLAEALLFDDDNHKRRAMQSAFCSRDQLAEARNAITCALPFFVLTSIAIRHAARDITRGWRNLLKRPLADDVPCSRDHSQNVLAR
jgi:hypothetical protein